MSLRTGLARVGCLIRPATTTIPSRTINRSPSGSVRSISTLPKSPSTGWVPTPYVTETVGGAWHTYDIFSRLLKERIVSINGPIDDTLSASIVAQLLFLEAESPEKPINLYINSPGGVVTAGLAIYDTMTYIRPPVTTICLGQAASMGSLLLAAGTPGMRLCLPNASIMVHQPSGGYAGQASDIAIHAREILRLRKRLNGIYLQHLNGAIKDRKTVKSKGNDRSSSSSSSSSSSQVDSTTPTSTTSGSAESQSQSQPLDPNAPTPEVVRNNSNRFIDLDVSQEEDLIAPRRVGIPWTLPDIERLMERDRFLDPEEALQMGIIDRILAKRGD